MKDATLLRHLDAVCALTDRKGEAGIDWQLLDAQRLKLADFIVAAKHGAVAVKFGGAAETRATADALEGILNGLDWLTDLAHEAGVLKRDGDTPPPSPASGTQA